MRYSIPKVGPQLDATDWIRRRSKAVAERSRMQSAPSATSTTLPGAILDWFRNPFHHQWAAPDTRPSTKRGEGDPIRYVSAKELRRIDPQMGEANALAVARRLDTALPRYGVSSPPQVAAFVAQAMAESDGFTDYDEDLSPYRAGRLQTTYGRGLFPTLASETPYRNDPARLANYVYATRNGNDRPGDGYRYRGRGPIQVTGRGNYRLVGHENDPDTLYNDPDAGFDASTHWWDANGLTGRTATWLPRSGFDGVTRSVNGTRMHKAPERWANYQRAQAAMARRQSHPEEYR